MSKGKAQPKQGITAPTTPTYKIYKLNHLWQMWEEKSNSQLNQNYILKNKLSTQFSLFLIFWRSNFSRFSLIYLIQLTPLLDLDLVSTLIRHGHLFGLKSYLAQAFNMWTRGCHNPYCTSLDAFPKSMLDLNLDLDFRPEIIIRLWTCESSMNPAHWQPYVALVRVWAMRRKLPLCALKPKQLLTGRHVHAASWQWSMSI